MALFTLGEARSALVELRPVIEEFLSTRADAAELGAALQGGPTAPQGGLPEFKAAQAKLDDLMTRMQETGAELKGVAPLLLDFAGEIDGTAVLWCWLEGDDDITWYHRADLGFAGRRRLPPTE